MILCLIQHTCQKGLMSYVALTWKVSNLYESSSSHDLFLLYEIPQVMKPLISATVATIHSSLQCLAIIYNEWTVKKIKKTSWIKYDHLGVRLSSIKSRPLVEPSWSIFNPGWDDELPPPQRVGPLISEQTDQRQFTHGW